MKTFCGFTLLEYTLWQKHENPELEINKNFLQQKTCVANKHNDQETANKILICETIKISVSYIKTKYFNTIKTMHIHNINTRK